MPTQSAKQQIDSDNLSTNKNSGISLISSIDWLRSYLLPSAVILLMVTIFLLGFEGYRFIQRSHATNKQSVELTSKLNILSQKLSSSGEQGQFINDDKKILTELPNLKSADLQYKSLFNLQFRVNGQYAHSHNPKLREFLVELDNFVKQNYPNMYKKIDFSVTCADEKCGSLKYPSEIIKIKEKIEKADLGLNKQAMLDSLYAAALTKEDDKNTQFFYYNLVLNLLGNEARGGNNLANTLASDLETYIKQTFVQQYDQLQTFKKIKGGQ